MIHFELCTSMSTMYNIMHILKDIYIWLIFDVLDKWFFIFLYAIIFCVILRFAIKEIILVYNVY